MSEEISSLDLLHKRRMDGLRKSLGPVIVGALADPDVVEIMLNDDGKLWIESLGKMTFSGMISASDGMTILNQVSSSLGGQMSKENPFVEGELPLNGERFEGIAPPVTESAIFAIRKKAIRVFTLDDYVRTGVLKFKEAEVLRVAIVGAQNILVVGGTGSGKTTFCNALLHELSVLCPAVRMLIMEDTRELQCTLENRVFLRSTEWSPLERLSLAVKRLRPDRIAVGEVRNGGPAMELLKSWTSGHPGGLSTIHANSAYGGLEKLMQFLGEVSITPQPLLIADAVNYVVFLERTNRGRRIKEILQVSGYDLVTQRFLIEKIG